MLVPVVLSADGEYVLSPLDSSESMDNLLWTANGDYTNGFSFRSVGSGLYFAGLTYCNWTAINQTEDLWLPLEHTDGGTAKTILKSVRAEQIDPTAVKLYAGITTGYFNSVILITFALRMQPMLNSTNSAAPVRNMPSAMSTWTAAFPYPMH